MEINDGVLTELCVRFLLFLPAEEAEQQIERFFIHVQEAYWFYLDYYYQHDEQVHDEDKFRTFSFVVLSFLHVRGLTKWEPERTVEYHDMFKDYLARIPVAGAIIISDCKHVLLVRGFRCNSWGFPKGKIDQGETLMDCALREVREETGLDLTLLINEEHFVEMQQSLTPTRLFLINGVVIENQTLRTSTRREIAEIRWFPLNKLHKIRKTRSCSNMLHLLSF